MGHRTIFDILKENIAKLNISLILQELPTKDSSVSTRDHATVLAVTSYLCKAIFLAVVSKHSKHHVERKMFKDRDVVQLPIGTYILVVGDRIYLKMKNIFFQFTRIIF